MLPDEKTRCDFVVMLWSISSSLNRVFVLIVTTKLNGKHDEGKILIVSNNDLKLMLLWDNLRSWNAKICLDGQCLFIKFKQNS